MRGKSSEHGETRNEYSILVEFMKEEDTRKT
jgi:hypothetical protein